MLALQGLQVLHHSMLSTLQSHNHEIFGELLRMYVFYTRVLSTQNITDLSRSSEEEIYPLLDLLQSLAKCSIYRNFDHLLTAVPKTKEGHSDASGDFVRVCIRSLQLQS
jgi:hypothetical protein